jgi:hypothetical protein
MDTKGMKSLQKGISGSLNCVDNIYVKVIIYVILILYSSTIFENINMYVGSLYKYSFVKIIVLLLIVALSMKCPAMGILLAISYLVSIIYEKHSERPLNLIRREGFSDADDDDERRDKRQERRNKRQDEINNEESPIESFIPTISRDNNDEFDMNSNDNSGYCPPNLVSDSLSNPCTPVATFKGELNAQGLNQISGFDDFVTGAPL